MHGCSGHRMLLEHERYYGLGMDALLIVCSWNTKVYNEAKCGTVIRWLPKTSMLVRASKPSWIYQRKRTCQSVVNALLDCWSQLIAKTEGAPRCVWRLHRNRTWDRAAQIHTGSPAPFVQQGACTLREWMQIQHAMAPLLWAV